MSLVISPLQLQRRGYTVLALSVLPSVTNIFRHNFLSNHASQPLQTWYGALTRLPTHPLPDSRPPVFYAVLKLTLFSDIISSGAKFSSPFSQQPKS